MKQKETPPTPTKEQYVIVKNLDDHVGYNGEPVTIFKKLPDDYLLVRNEQGKLWYVGEEEIKRFEPKEQYLEPVGFKGTKGKWNINSYGFKTTDDYGNAYWNGRIFTEGHQITTGDKQRANKTGTIISTTAFGIFGDTPKQAEANALLFSQSKELAKALQDDLEFFEEWNGNGNYTERIEKIKSVLKQAGLTNE